MSRAGRHRGGALRAWRCAPGDVRGLPGNPPRGSQIRKPVAPRATRRAPPTRPKVPNSVMSIERDRAPSGAPEALPCGTRAGSGSDKRAPPVSPAQGARGGRGGSRLASPSTPRDTRLEARRTLRPKVRARYLRAPRALRAPRRVRHRSWGSPGGWKQSRIGPYAPRACARDRADPMGNPPPHPPALAPIAHLSLGSCRPRSRAAARRGRLTPPPAAHTSGTRPISDPPRSRPLRAREEAAEARASHPQARRATHA